MEDEYYANRAFVYYDLSQYQLALNDFNESILLNENNKILFKEELEKCEEELKFKNMIGFFGENAENICCIFFGIGFVLMLIYDGRLKLIYERRNGTLTPLIKRQIFFQGMLWLIVFLALAVLIITFNGFSIRNIILSCLIGSLFLLFKSIIPNYSKLHNYDLPEGFTEIVKFIIDKFFNKT